MEMDTPGDMYQLIDKNLDKLEIHWDEDGFWCRSIYAVVVLSLHKHLHQKGTLGNMGGVL